MIALLVLALAATPDPYAQALDAYRAGQLDRCEALLDGLLVRPTAPPPDVLAPSLVLRAAVAFARNHPATAREDLVRAHGAAPVTLSPEIFPPDFRDFDVQVQREEAARIAKLQSSPVEAPLPPAPARVILLKPPAPPSPMWALVPLGVPQRRRGATVWGDVLGAAQVAALGTGLGSLGAALAMQDSRGLYTPAQAPTARALNGAYLAGVYGALTLYVVGVVDAFAFGSSPK